MSQPPTTRNRLGFSPVRRSFPLLRQMAVLIVALLISISAEHSVWARCGSIAHLNTVDIQKLTGYDDGQLLLMPKVYVVYDGGRVSFSFRPVSLPPCRGPECQSRETPADAGVAVALGTRSGADVGFLRPASVADNARAGERLFVFGLVSLPSGFLSLPLRPPIGG